MIPQSKTLVITSYPKAWEELAKITCATHKAWADRHGYDYYADCSDLLDNYYNPHMDRMERLPIKGFVKIDLFLHFLKKYDVVCWLDADMAVTNLDIPVSHWLEQKPNAHVILPFDWNGINATVLISRNTELAYDFWWSVNNTGRKFFLKNDWVEMYAARFFAMTPPYDGEFLGYLSIADLCPLVPEEYVPYVPLEVSAKYGWKPDSWTVHFSALPLARRIELALEYADKCK